MKWRQVTLQTQPALFDTSPAQQQQPAQGKRPRGRPRKDTQGQQPAGAGLLASELSFQMPVTLIGDAGFKGYVIGSIAGEPGRVLVQVAEAGATRARGCKPFELRRLKRWAAK